MKSKIAFVLAVSLLLTTVAIPAAFAYTTAYFKFTLSDKRGLQGSYQIADNDLKKDTTLAYAAVRLDAAKPVPSHTIRTCIVNFAGNTATSSGVWYTYGGSAAKPKFNSPTTARGQQHRAAMRLNTDERQAQIVADGAYTLDWA